MTDIKFDCPHCQNNLAVDESGAGMTVNCPLCQKALVIPPTGTLNPEPAIPSPRADQKQPAKGSSLFAAIRNDWGQIKESVAEASHQFMESVNEASRGFSVVYVSGAYGLQTKQACKIIIEEDNLVLVEDNIFKQKEVFRIPHSNIIDATVDSFKRISGLRVALIGIAAPLFKKTEKILELEFNDETGTKVSVILGRPPGSVEMETLQGRILEARRDFHRRHPKPAPQQESIVSSTNSQIIDIPGQIQKLADLHKQGVLTAAEFEKKKAELLARI